MMEQVKLSQEAREYLAQNFDPDFANRMYEAIIDVSTGDDCTCEANNVFCALVWSVSAVLKILSSKTFEGEFTSEDYGYAFYEVLRVCLYALDDNNHNKEQ